MRKNLPPVEMDDGTGVVPLDRDYEGRQEVPTAAEIGREKSLLNLIGVAMKERDAIAQRRVDAVVGVRLTPTLPEDLAREAAERVARIAGVDPRVPVMMVEETYEPNPRIQERLNTISVNLPNCPVVIPVQFGKPIYQHNADGSVQMTQMGRPKKAGGRKVTYRRERVEPMLELIRAGGTIDRAAKKTCIPIQDVYAWSNTIPEFNALLLDARRWGASALLDEISDIADDVKDSHDRAKVDAARLRVQTRQWLAERMLPKLYGPRQSVDTSTNVTFNIGIVRERLPVHIIDTPTKRIADESGS